MNIISKTKIGILASALFLSFSSHAALMEGDLYENGDGLTTIDTNTGIEWMDLTQTKGMSANEVLADPRFSGWRFPSAEEYTALIQSYLPDIDHDNRLTYYNQKAWPNKNVEIAQIKEMLSFFIGNERDADYLGLYGMYISGNGKVALSGGLLTSRNQYGVHRNAQFYGLNYGGGGDFDYKNGAYSMYLVKGGDVNAPLVGTIGALSLAAFGFRFRQRK